jgi:P4 family phage/plasmid primase-like protien
MTHKEELQALRKAALSLEHSGFAVVPIKQGEKRAFNKKWQVERLSADRLRWWFSTKAEDKLETKIGGLGVVSGQMSKNLVVLDFDNLNKEDPRWAADGWKTGFEAVSKAFPKWATGALVKTGSGKRHAWVRVPDLPEDFTVEVWSNGKGNIEVRGNLCNNVAPPSTHPSGGKYEWVVAEAVYTVTLDELHAFLVGWGVLVKGGAQGKDGKALTTQDPVVQMAVKHHWSIHSTADQVNFTRPGKDPKDGKSATWDGDVFYVHTTNPPEPFETGKGYNTTQLLMIWEGADTEWYEEHLNKQIDEIKASELSKRALRPKLRTLAKFVAKRAGRGEDRPVADVLKDEGIITNSGLFTTMCADARRAVKATRTEDTAKPGHDEIAESWSDANPKVKYGLGCWRRYGEGFWDEVEEEVVRKSVFDTAVTSGYKSTLTDGGLRSMTALAHTLTHVEGHRWDADPDLIVMRNQVLDLRTMEFRGQQMEDYALGALPYAYDPDAKCLNFEKATRRACNTEEEFEFLMEFGGLCLTTVQKHDLTVWLVGAPGGGRSCILKGFETAVGPTRTTSLGLARLQKSQFALTNLPGKTLSSNAEQPPTTVTVADILNKLISGDLVECERKREHQFPFRPTVKFLLAMNEAPAIPTMGSGAGLRRRVKYLFTAPPLPEDERDISIREAISDEGPGIFNLFLEGLKRLRERGHFEYPETVVDHTAQIHKETDRLEMFLEESGLVFGEDLRFRETELYEYLVDHYKTVGAKAPALDKIRLRLGSMLVVRGAKRKRKVEGYTYWYGVSAPGFGERKGSSRNWVRHRASQDQRRNYFSINTGVDNEQK